MCTEALSLPHLARAFGAFTKDGDKKMRCNCQKESFNGFANGIHIVCVSCISCRSWSKWVRPVCAFYAAVFFFLLFARYFPRIFAEFSFRAFRVPEYSSYTRYMHALTPAILFASFFGIWNLRRITVFIKSTSVVEFNFFFYLPFLFLVLAMLEVVTR